MVKLTEGAKDALEEIYDFIHQHDSPGKADRVLDQIEEAFARLSEFPQRGNCPKELLEVGNREFREIYFKPYRVIYRVVEKNVYVLVIADGKRAMQTLR